MICDTCGRDVDGADFVSSPELGCVCCQDCANEAWARANGCIVEVNHAN